MEHTQAAAPREPWNKGKIVGQKAPLKMKDIWALRVRLQLASRVRELALFNLGIDSKLRGCDLVKLKVRDVCHGEQVAARAIVMQQKTQRPVQFEITQPTRETLQTWIKQAGLRSDDFLFPSRIHGSPAPRNALVRADLRGMDRRARARQCGLRNAFDTADQGDAHLPANEESSGRAAIARPYQAGEHSPLSRNRGRRRD